VLLAASVGLPYFTLATNSTLVQVWFGRRFPGRSAYWLYAFSNSGSLLALLSYPVLIEPTFAIHAQGRLWSFAFIAFGALSIAMLRRGMTENGEGVAAAEPAHAEAKPSGWVQALWVALAASASTLLLAVTNQLTADVAPIPLLWIIPLSLYLLSFIIAFSGERWYYRPLFSVLLIGTSVVVGLLQARPFLGFAGQIGAYALFLFAACMSAHGELYRLRPGAAHLSRFYLLVSVGGALGGVFVNLVAPVAFPSYWELYIGWALVVTLLAVSTFVSKTHELPRRLRFAHDAVVGAMAVIIVLAAYVFIRYSGGSNAFFDRNFFGVLRVYEDEGDGIYTMLHGSTLHGKQFIAEELRAVPTTYYWEGSGIGLLLRNHPRPEGNLHVGLLGLGAGTLGVYGEPGDAFRYYEINPMVVELAEGQGGYYSFVPDSAAETMIVLGDARISLENELAAGAAQDFDVLVLDTFSGDSIPVHLLTEESFALYLEHLKPTGVIAVHISNRYLDLQPVLWQLAEAHGLHMGVIEVFPPEDASHYANVSLWALLTRDSSIFFLTEIAEHVDLLESYTTDVRLWTDDYSNLFQILH
jgi:hypothetical protein